MPVVHDRFDVKTRPQPAESDTDFAAVARLLLDQRYYGPLDAVSRGQLLAVGGEGAGASTSRSRRPMAGSKAGAAASFSIIASR
ncbi:MAG: hypothetical protein P4M09_00255 [Devosia sp.]|nr:hypothetical protein [Devosia sp.]